MKHNPNRDRVPLWLRVIDAVEEDEHPPSARMLAIAAVLTAVSVVMFVVAIWMPDGSIYGRVGGTGGVLFGVGIFLATTAAVWRSM